MATVVVSCYNVASFAEGGGHFWVYMQYVQGLRQAGCDVYWLERFRRGRDPSGDARAITTFFARMTRFGLDGKVLLYTQDQPSAGGAAVVQFIGVARAEAEAVLRRADLVLNFHYAIDPSLLACARRSALVDIDPGLLQFWISTGQLRVPPHDVYLTIGETVGTPAARFPDCGLPWIQFHPPVCLDHWPYTYDPRSEAFTTVAGWWSGQWVRGTLDGAEIFYENTKRVSFLEFVALPRRTRQPLELALYFAADDGDDRALLESHGWRVRHSRDVAGGPEQYQAYIQRSRGEFSTAKPSCMKLQNAWISDRTLCYLASGKPAVVQHTGPSAYLPNGEGLFRFATIDEAAAALDAVNTDYPRQCQAARELAAAHFDARGVLERILSISLGVTSR
ncbi:MAG: glycosyltransferase [Gemmatimonadales bacterium]